MTNPPDDLAAYFNVADELDGGLELLDLEAEYLVLADRAAVRLSLPWPPVLADAEEAYLRWIDKEYLARRRGIA